MNLSNPKSIRIETTKGQMEKAIMDGIRECILIHGDVTPHFMGSCAKRIIGQLKRYIVELDDICKCGSTMTSFRRNRECNYMGKSITVNDVPMLSCHCGVIKIPTHSKARLGEILKEIYATKSIVVNYSEV